MTAGNGGNTLVRFIVGGFVIVCGDKVIRIWGVFVEGGSDGAFLDVPYFKTCYIRI